MNDVSTHHQQSGRSYQCNASARVTTCGAGMEATWSMLENKAGNSTRLVTNVVFEPQSASCLASHRLHQLRASSLKPHTTGWHRPAPVAPAPRSSAVWFAADPRQPAFPHDVLLAPVVPAAPAQTDVTSWIARDAKAGNGAGCSVASPPTYHMLPPSPYCPRTRWTLDPVTLIRARHDPMGGALTAMVASNSGDGGPWHGGTERWTPGANGMQLRA
ncbi:hypothetical protein C8R44DRAFT_736271 [Mycena epipterygia]|nr:hypothetical protein C8R44DRAFT_736271 [Mycena epipterygia]